jgi:hypothetical protein
MAKTRKLNHRDIDDDFQRKKHPSKQQGMRIINRWVEEDYDDGYLDDEDDEDTLPSKTHTFKQKFIL